MGFAQLLDAAQPANPGKTLPSAETTEAAAAKPVRKAQHNAADAGKTSRSMAIDIAAAAERAEAATSQVAPATAFEAPTVQADPVVDATAPAGASAAPYAPALDASLWLAAWAAAPRAASPVIETPAAPAVAATATPEIDASRATAKPAVLAAGGASRAPAARLHERVAATAEPSTLDALPRQAPTGKAGPRTAAAAQASPPGGAKAAVADAQTDPAAVAALSDTAQPAVANAEVASPRRVDRTPTLAGAEAGTLRPVEPAAASAEATSPRHVDSAAARQRPERSAELSAGPRGPGPTATTSFTAASAAPSAPAASSAPAPARGRPDEPAAGPDAAAALPTAGVQGRTEVAAAQGQQRSESKVATRPLPATEGAAAPLRDASPTAGADIQARVTGVARDTEDVAVRGRPAPIASASASLELTSAASSALPSAYAVAAPAIYAQAAADATGDGGIAASPGSPDFAPQLAAHLTTFVRDGVQHAKLELNPAEMGPLTVQIQLDGNAAHVHLAAENAQTRQALEQAMPQLAGSLRESGLTLSGGGVSEQPRQAPQQQQQAQAGGSGGRNAGGQGDSHAGTPDAPSGASAAPPARRLSGVVDLIA